jgi:sarcosine dehydrogenase
MIQKAEIIIVGGGIWGLSTAYHLARLGQKDVCILERNPQVAAETTPQAAGLVGQVRSTRTMMGAIRYALELFSEFGDTAGFRQTGSLMVALNAQRMDAYEKQVELAHQNGVDADFVSHAEMKRLAPAMDTSQVVGGYFVPQDGYVNPGRCAHAYCDAAKSLGVHIELGMRATGVRVRGDTVVGVETELGFIEADRVVLTAGPWSSILSKTAGFPAAMQPIRHQRARTVPAAGIPDHHPVVRVTDRSCYLRPEQGGYLYGFFEPDPMSIDLDEMPPDFGTKDLEPPVSVMTEAQRRLSPIFPILENLEIAERNQGVTTFAPDGSYLIGPVQGVANLFLATGCAALGIAGSAAIGRWLAKWVVDGHPGENLSMFAPERFGERGSDREWIRRESEQFYANYYSIRSE